MNKKINDEKEKEEFRAYFHDSVVLAYDEYVKKRNSESAGQNADLRAATNAIEHLYHVREHLPDEVSATWKEIRDRSNDYALLGDIANALKHKKLTKGKPRLTRSKNIYEETVVTSFKDSKGTYSHAETVVMAKLDDGTRYDVLDILTNVMNMWLLYLHEVGFSKKKPKLFSLRDPHKVVKRKDRRNHNFAMTKGTELTKRFRMQRFNYDTGKVEPINLTGSDVVFRVYRKPLRVVDLRAISPSGDNSLNFRIVFSDEDDEKFGKLKTKKSKGEFVKNIVDERRKRKKRLVCNDGTTEYDILLPDDYFKKMMRQRKDETRQKFLTDLLKNIDAFSVEKGDIKVKL
jgi:hypothetical protein